MKKNKLTTILFLSLILFSCSNGKIELRKGIDGCGATEESKKAILMNRSSDKKITFTIKEINVDKPEKYSISTITLFPGEEHGLGCTEEIQRSGWTDYTADTLHYEYKIVGELVENK